MSPKLPAKGTVKSNTSTRLPHPPDASRRPGNASLHDVDVSTLSLGEPIDSTHGGGARHSAVFISQTTSDSATALPTERRPLEDFWITSKAALPAPDPQGFRTVKGRHYVDLPDGHSVQVVLDSQSGFHRARLASERDPSGPWLVRDHDSKLWKPLDDSPEKLRIRSAADLDLEIERLTKVLDESDEYLNKLKHDWRALKGTEDERSAIVRYEVQGHKHLAHLEKLVAFYATEQRSLVRYKGVRAYEIAWLDLHKDQLKTYYKISTISESRWRLSAPANTMLTDEHYRAMATYLKNRLVLLRKRQIVGDEVQKLSRNPIAVLEQLGYHPADIHKTTADWVFAKSQAMSAAHFARIPQLLSMSFLELVDAFGNVDSIPSGVRLCALSHLIDKCGLIKKSYETLDIQRDAIHSASREEIVEVINTFEIALEERFDFYYRKLQSAASIPRLTTAIDFDFRADQRMSGRPAIPAKMFQSPDDPGEIRIGQKRRTAEGEELIDVMHPRNPEMLQKTYQRRNAEWRHFVVSEEKSLAKLTLEARLLLASTDEHLRTAHHARTVEDLHYSAREVDDLRLQIERASNPLTGDTALLVQRLSQVSERLRKAAVEVRIHRYKNQSVLSADQVAYLFDHNHLSAKRVHTRLERGEGQHKEFVDVYALNDTLTGKPFCIAHFHYEKKNSPELDFKPHGGHLETIEQAGPDVLFLRQDGQPGRPLKEIWRLTLDQQTADSIFSFAV
ncbi:hypothetical protein [Pseudomonas sp. B33.4]|uniref:hypothetical protein n=1 Tax=Pseudomonas sp. B33.4 TaxID=3104265 RepID=UPI002ADEC113|nr:hypothetical protein [Pseudomonas sp. B33.4]